MSDETREDQSKSARPAASAGRLSRSTARTSADPAARVDPAARKSPGPAAPIVPAPSVPGPSVPAPSLASPARTAADSEAEWDADVATGADAESEAGADQDDDSDDDSDDDLDYDDEEGDEEEEDAGPPKTFVERLRSLSPAQVILTVGSIASLVFMLRAVTSHTTPVPVLLSAGVVCGLVFAVDAAVASFAIWRASQEGRIGRALLLVAIGGSCVMFSAGSFAGVFVMLLVLAG